jgi:putative effector of murein hydrolase LrgA (UPF0299 family)
MIRSLSILVLLQLGGEVLAKALSLPLPGGLVGLLLLLLALLVRRRVDSEMQQTSQVLLQNLMLLFIPFIAGIVAQLDQLKAQWLSFLAACVLGAVASLVATAWTLRRMLSARPQGKP